MIWKMSSGSFKNQDEKIGNDVIIRLKVWKRTMLQACTLAMSFEMRSRIRPGVATMTWTGLSSRRISSRRSVPPVVARTFNPQCLPISIQIWEVWRANSRVGTKTRPRKIIWNFSLILSDFREKVELEDKYQICAIYQRNLENLPWMSGREVSTRSISGIR